MFKKILWVTDFSEHAHNAGKQALACARCCEGGAVDVLAVVDPEDLPLVLAGEPSLFVAPQNEARAEALLQDEYEQRVRDRLAEETAFLREAGVPTSLHIRVGTPWKEIVGAAEALGSTLMVIGSHGRRGLGEILLGSTTENVTRHAPCPVLVVR